MWYSLYLRVRAMGACGVCGGGSTEVQRLGLKWFYTLLGRLPSSFFLATLFLNSPPPPFHTPPHLQAVQLGVCPVSQRLERRTHSLLGHLALRTEKGGRKEAG